MIMIRRAAALLAALIVAVATGLAGAAPASAASDGHLRLAHLSPDTPKVDVYLTAVSGRPAPQKFPGVGYGVMSAYLALPAGEYSVAMRKAGAAASTPAVLSTSLMVAAGHSYTVAGVGRYADLGLKVFDDDLTAPAAGHSRIRVIHASVRAPSLDLSLVDGPTLATGATFATTSDYQDVPSGTWTLRMRPKSGTPADVKLKLAAGSVYSLLILDGANGKLTVVPRLDAKGMPVMPAGPVEAGAGGMAASPSAGLITAGALLLVTLLLLLGVRRRRLTP